MYIFVHCILTSSGYIYFVNGAFLFAFEGDMNVLLFAVCNFFFFLYLQPFIFLGTVKLKFLNRKMFPFLEMHRTVSIQSFYELFYEFFKLLLPSIAVCITFGNCNFNYSMNITTLRIFFSRYYSE